MPQIIDKIRLIFSLIAIFLIPGWSFISVTGLWRMWRPLQRWIVAIAASIAFYPILFYIVRFISPSIHIGINKNLVLLSIGLLIILIMLRKNWREQFAFDQWEIFALVIIGVTIFTRFWIIRDQPYPAWTDSLHHVLLTKITAETGRLPFTLEPYSSTTLGMYHLGLYAITGVVEQLSGTQAHTALLWTAQLLNGLCAIGIYFLLDRFAGKWAALAGLVVAGLISFQPAWYVNWGRFTQLASQTIILVALGVTWQSLINESEAIIESSKLRTIGLVILAAGLNASVFLLHFRVAIYYFPLLLTIVIFGLISSVKQRQVKKLVATFGLIGATSLFLILPALIPALNMYLGKKYQEGLMVLSDSYFGYTTQTIFTLGLRPLLFWITFLLGVLAIFSSHRRLAVITWIWVITLVVEGSLYKLGLSVLRFTNFSGMIIGLYLPAAILIGLGIEALADRFGQKLPGRFSKIFIYSFFLIGFIGSFYRSSGIEPWRFFMTEYDRQAMDWINTNTSANATFAINTYQWLGIYPHGTDGGYWIPYFTGRQTNTGSMLVPTDKAEEMKVIQERSQAIVNYVNGNGTLESLCTNNLDYIYIGKGNVLSTAFDSYTLIRDPLAKLVYQNPGVMIFQLCATASGN